MAQFTRALAGTALVTVALGGPAAAQSLVISNWDGYMPEDLLDRFTEATGIAAELSVHATNEEIMGRLVAGGGAGFDVVFVSSPFAEALHALGLTAELNHDLIPNAANLYPEAQNLEYDPGNTFSMPYAWGTTGLCYRADLVETAPTSWTDLLDPPADLAGEVTMLSTDRWLMAAGLLALGYSVNDTDPAHIDEARDLLISATDTLLAFDDTTFYSRLVSGEASLVHAWDGWCNYGTAEDPNILFVVPQEGSDLWVDTMVIMASSENQEAAHAFIDFVLDAANHRWVAENILYKVPNEAAMAGLDPALVEAFPNLGMTPGELLEMEQLRDLGEAQRDYTRAVTEVMAAQ
ncbi:MAG: spermidine/putrescine ABC transporter substrate-binding protein [Rhodospirillaceae bacterium]|nr:spermidine/putrescine ABC transporter substrate-binding protein [Rhodospirillaceae bacterium]